MNSTEDGETPQRPSVFISHRHGDQQIADIVRDFLLSRTGGRVRVYQSTYVGSGPCVGELLTHELGDELSRSEVVFLIYTVADENWSYCMWECGVAFDPRASDTRIVVLQCARDIPAPLADRVSVQLTDPEQVKRFVVQLLTKDDFFPRYGRPITGFTADDPAVLRAGEELFASLAIEDRPDSRWWAWPWLKLELNFEHEARIRYLLEGNDHDQACQFIATNTRVVKHDRRLPLIFGLADFPDDFNLQDVIENWARAADGHTDKSWSGSLLDQVARAALWKQPRANWKLLNHVEDEEWYAPILFRVTKMPRGRKFEFDILFPRIYRDWKPHESEVIDQPGAVTP